MALTKISHDDNDKAVFGTSEDLQIYHNGSHSYIDDAGTGGLKIRVAGTDDNGFYKYSSDEKLGIFKPDGAVELYHDGSKKFETSATGITVTGEVSANGNLLMNHADGHKIYLGMGDDLQIYHDGTDNILLSNGASCDLLVYVANGELAIKAIANGAVELYHNNVKKFETASTGCYFDGHVMPGSNGAYDLGLNATRWGDVYIKDAKKIKLGDSNDLEIYHDGNNSKITHTGQGDLAIGAGAIQLESENHGELLAKFTENGAVKLYYDNSNKFETNANGVEFNGNTYMNDAGKSYWGTGDDLEIWHNGTYSAIKADNLKIVDKANNHGMITALADGAVGLRYDNTEKFATTSGGGVLTGHLVATSGIIIRRATSYASSDADELIIGDEAVDANQGMTILSHTTKAGSINFGDGANPNGHSRGIIKYDHNDDSLAFSTAITERLRITSSGVLRQVGGSAGLGSSDSIAKLTHYTIDPTTPGGVGDVTTFETTSSTSNGSDYRFRITKREGSGGGSCYLDLGGSSDGSITFGTNTSGSGTERLRIDSSGNVWLNGNGSYNTDKQVFNADGTSGLVEATNELNIFQNKSSSGALYIGYKDIANGGTITDYRFYNGTGSDTVANISCASLAVASGGGIDFSANSHAGGMTSELLDDYEEGTFTPVFSGGLTGTGYGYQSGTYTKIGRAVHWTLIIKISSGESTSSSVINIDGFPFTSLNSSPQQGGGSSGPFYNDQFFDSTAGFSGIQIDNGTQLRLYRADNGAYLTGSLVDGDREMRMSGYYHAA